MTNEDIIKYASSSPENTNPNVLRSLLIDLENSNKPSGSVTLETNGTHDVTEYEEAKVQVPASAVVSGTKSITTNGTDIDVTEYATVNVNVNSTTWQGQMTLNNNTGYAITVYTEKEGEALVQATTINNGESATIAMPCNMYKYSSYKYYHVGGTFYIVRAYEKTKTLVVTQNGLGPPAYAPSKIYGTDYQGNPEYFADAIIIKQMTTQKDYKTVTYTLTTTT